MLAWANCVVYPDAEGNAKACDQGVGRRTDTYAFFVYLREQETLDYLPISGCLRGYKANSTYEKESDHYDALLPPAAGLGTEHLYCQNGGGC